MNGEDSYVLEQFQQHFLHLPNVDLVIYGVGLRTQRLLEKLPTDAVAGLMDQQKTDEMLWGKPVLSLEAVAHLANPLIIILARQSVIQTIYRRIESFTKSKQIPVYTIDGQRLDKQVLTATPKPCFSLDEAALHQKIARATVVSFDVFDTLITRRVARPVDIFQIMQEKYDLPFDFAQKRHEVELSLSAQEPTILEIYQQLQQVYQLADDEMKKWLAYELQTEKHALVRREYLCQLLEQCYVLGKKVYLISDMYLPKAMLRELLADLDIHCYHELFVSCEYRCTKEKGLLQIYCETVGVPARQCLHIGDNYYSDILAAQSLEMMSYRVYQPFEMLEYSPYQHLVAKAESLEERIILATFATTAYNHPFGSFDKAGKIIIQSDEQLATLMVAPLIFKFMLYLIQCSHDLKLSAIVFPSRDGYLLLQIYQQMQAQLTSITLPKAYYFYTSRRSALVAAVENEQDLQRILTFPNQRPFHAMLSQRFGDIVAKESLADLTPADYQSLLAHCHKERLHYLDYIEKAWPKQEQVGFVDLIAVGTIQEALERLLHQRLQGIYFKKRTTDETFYRQLTICSLLDSADDITSQANGYRYYYFLENILSSFEPSFRGIDDAGNLQFEKERRTPNDLHCLQRVHQQIQAYCLAILPLCNNPLAWQSKVDIYDEFLGLFAKEHSSIVHADLLKMKNIDDFIGQEITDFNR